MVLKEAPPAGPRGPASPAGRRMPVFLHKDELMFARIIALVLLFLSLITACGGAPMPGECQMQPLCPFTGPEPQCPDQTKIGTPTTDEPTLPPPPAQETRRERPLGWETYVLVSYANMEGTNPDRPTVVALRSFGNSLREEESANMAEKLAPRSMETRDGETVYTYLPPWKMPSFRESHSVSAVLIILSPGKIRVEYEMTFENLGATIWTTAKASPAPAHVQCVEVEKMKVCGSTVYRLEPHGPVLRCLGEGCPPQRNLNQGSPPAPVSPSPLFVPPNPD